jgi:hypothetical protein
MKFNDLDADGVKDAGEPGLAGWTIYVDYDGDGTKDAGEPFAVTAAGGSYTITGINPGTYDVREVAQAGWTCSYPNVVPDLGFYDNEVFVSGGTNTGNDFGNWTGEIKIEKKDIHGVIITLPGFTVTVSPNPYGAGILTVVDNGPGGLDPYDTDMTFGTIDLKNVPLGSYTFTEIAAPAGYIVDPIPQTQDVSSSTPVTFISTDEEYGHLEIFKFNDKDGDGIYDPLDPILPETPLQNWEFTITGGPTPVPGKYYTDATGWIHTNDLPDLIPGDYTVTETEQPPDWVCTTGNPRLATVPDGGTASVEFGNRYIKRTLRIYKFNDLNGNGVPDPGERPLEGWEFTISGIGTRVTGANGWIIINISIPDIYTVTETLQPNWLCTTDNPQYADLILADDVTLYFGNVEHKDNPPYVPTIGTWGTALMAVAFAGALIWVVALRRKRRTI